MQIATWNVNSLKVRLPQVLDWLENTNCDVLALQELKLENNNFPLAAFSELGYECVFNGQKTYNGVAIISKLPITDVCYDMPNYLDEQKRVIAATINGIKVVCVYVVNGESVTSAKFDYKISWLTALQQYISNILIKHNKLVLLGDFNIAPHDIDVYDPLSWQGQVLCSTAEREFFNQLLNLGLHDGFRLFNQQPGQYSWWDYRNLAFRRKQGLRIDHVLLTNELKQVASSCVIDIEPRKSERPSDHAPVIVTLDL
jgi:exodeoxyribonuclease-3